MRTAIVVALAAVLFGLVVVPNTSNRPLHRIASLQLPFLAMRLPRHSLAPHHTDEGSSNIDLIKPRVDTLQYRFFTLPNRLRCLVISDPETEKAAAALDVRTQ